MIEKKENLKMAILMVNGKFNYKNHLWIELSINRILKHTSPHTKYKIFLWNHDFTNPRVTSYLDSVKKYVEVLSEENFDLAHWQGVKCANPVIKVDYFAGGCHVHRGPLQMLYEFATRKYEVEVIFTFDSDSFPIRDNWEIPLAYRLEKDIKLAGVWRDELQAVIPPFIHASGLGITTETIKQLNLRFDYEPMSPREDTLSHFTHLIRQHFGQEVILPLKRSNKNEYHAVFNGVYGGFIYHHHLGTRYRDGKSKEPKTYGWQERNESPEYNKFILDGTTHRIFEDTDDFLDELVYGDKAFDLKLYSNYLKNTNSDDSYKRLLEEAKKLSSIDPSAAYYISGLIGKHYALDKEYLHFYQDVCASMNYRDEAEIYSELSGSGERSCLKVEQTIDTMESLGIGLKPGDSHYRAYVGPPKEYDLITAMTFNLLTSMGLRQHHSVLDIGCGSLRVGRLLIPYLNSGRYTGIEPHEWLVNEGIRREIGSDLIRIKKPRFFFAGDPGVLPGDIMFDFAVAQSVFSHGTLEFIERWLTGIFSHLHSNGALLATFKQGDKDFFHPDGIIETDFRGDGWIYPKCPSYRPETIQKAANRCGFRFQILDWKHPRQTWALFAREKFDTSWFENKILSWNTFIDSII